MAAGGQRESTAIWREREGELNSECELHVIKIPFLQESQFIGEILDSRAKSSLRGFQLSQLEPINEGERELERELYRLPHLLSECPQFLSLPTDVPLVLGPLL